MNSFCKSRALNASLVCLFRKQNFSKKKKKKGHDCTFLQPFTDFVYGKTSSNYVNK